MRMILSNPDLVNMLQDPKSNEILVPGDISIFAAFRRLIYSSVYSTQSVEELLNAVSMKVKTI